MYIIKNAIRCIMRSKGRNVLIGIIVLVISVSACIGLSIRQAAQSTKEDTLAGMNITATISFDRQSMMSNMKPGEGGEFDRDSFANMMGEAETLTLEDYQKYAAADSVTEFYYTLSASFNQTDEFSAVTTESTSDVTSEDTNDFGGFAGGFSGKPDGGMNRFGMASGDFTVMGYSSDIAMTSFINGTSAITDGKVFEAGTNLYECIITTELAAFNDIAVGDKIKLSNPNSEEEIYELKVVGIYSDSDANNEFQRMPGSDPANNIYMSYNALNAIIEASAEVSQTVTEEDTGREYETAMSGTLNATYIFENSDAYADFEKEVRELGLSDSYTVSSQDITEFENSLVPLKTLSTMAGWFLLVILIIGAIILIVLNIFNIRERKYEIGVLMAMGMKKKNVAMQFLTEIFAVTMVAVVIGVAIGAVSAVRVTNVLLENQITSSENENAQIEQSFGRGEMPDMGNMNGFGGAPQMQRPDNENFNFGGKAANYISEIDSAMDFTVIIQMFGIAVLLTLIAGSVAILFVTRYEPLKILSNRD